MQHELKVYYKKRAKVLHFEPAHILKNPPP